MMLVEPAPEVVGGRRRARTVQYGSARCHRPTVKNYGARKTSLDGGTVLRLATEEERTIDRLVRDMRTVAVVGLSDRPTRPSHSVAAYLQRAGVRIVPVNPNLVDRTVLGERVYPAVGALPPEPRIDLFDIFRRSEFVAPIVGEILARGEGAIWMQLGVIDEAAAARARGAGHDVVMDRCLAVEHRLRLR